MPIAQAVTDCFRLAWGMVAKFSRLGVYAVLMYVCACEQGVG